MPVFDLRKNKNFMKEESIVMLPIIFAENTHVKNRSVTSFLKLILKSATSYHNKLTKQAKREQVSFMIHPGTLKSKIVHNSLKDASYQISHSKDNRCILDTKK